VFISTMERKEGSPVGRIRKSRFDLFNQPESKPLFPERGRPRTRSLIGARPIIKDTSKEPSPVKPKPPTEKEKPKKQEDGGALRRSRSVGRIRQSKKSLFEKGAEQPKQPSSRGRSPSPVLRRLGTPINLPLTEPNQLVVLKPELKTSKTIKWKKETPENLRGLFAALKSNSIPTTSLDLSSNEIGDENAKLLANALKVNTSLTELNLFSSNIRNDGAVAIFDALKENKTLKNLNMASNRISFVGGKAACEALKINSTLTLLNLEYSDLGPKGAQYISLGLKENKGVTELNLNANSIADYGLQYIAEALKVNRTLSRLMLDVNNIGVDPDGCHLLAEALKVNNKLKELHLKRNVIEDVSAGFIVSCLSQNKTLCILVLRENPMGFAREQLEAIAQERAKERHEHVSFWL